MSLDLLDRSEEMERDISYVSSPGSPDLLCTFTKKGNTFHYSCPEHVGILRADASIVVPHLLSSHALSMDESLDCLNVAKKSAVIK